MVLHTFRCLFGPDFSQYLPQSAEVALPFALFPPIGMDEMKSQNFVDKEPAMAQNPVMKNAKLDGYTCTSMRSVNQRG